MVTVIDVPARKVIAQIPTGVEPEGMAVSPDGQTIVNTSETTNMAHFFDYATRKMVAGVLVDARPRVPCSGMTEPRSGSRPSLAARSA